MSKLIIRVTIAVALCIILGATGFAVKRDKDDRPVEKTTTSQKQGTTTKTVPTTTPATVTPPAEPAAADTTRAGEEVNWQVIASGGGLSNIGSMMLGSTIGQTAAGQTTLGEYMLNSGFQQNFESGEEGCCIGPIRGDVNYDGAELVDISDLFYFIDFMFTGGPAPVCFDEADIDASGSEPLDISDLLYLIDYMFTGGPAPPACP